MKFTVHKLRIGDKVWAQIVEHVSASEFIVSFQGDLIRVRNESLSELSINDKVLVRVMAVNPLAFQLLIEGERQSGAIRIDVRA
jgi:hypothetical protein